MRSTPVISRNMDFINYNNFQSPNLFHRIHMEVHLDLYSPVQDSRIPNTKKFKYFINDPMVGEKSVLALPGIGKVAAGKLRERGFDQVFKIYNQFIACGADEQSFTSWLKTCFGVNSKNSSSCFYSLWAWHCYYKYPRCPPFCHLYLPPILREE